MTLVTLVNTLTICDKINKYGNMHISINNLVTLNSEDYYLDEDELIKLRDHLNKLIEQIK